MGIYRYVAYCCGGAPSLFLRNLFYSPLDLGDIDCLAGYLDRTAKYRLHLGELVCVSCDKIELYPRHDG